MNIRIPEVEIDTKYLTVLLAYLNIWVTGLLEEQYRI